MRNVDLNSQQICLSSAAGVFLGVLACIGVGALLILRVPAQRVAHDSTRTLPTRTRPAKSSG